jgi:hypothetical protein
LITAFSRFKEWLDTAAVHPATKTSFWERLFGTRPKRGAFRRKDAEALAEELTAVIEILQGQLYSHDDAALQKITRRGQESTAEGEIGAEIGVSDAARVSARVGATNGTRTAEEIQETFRRTKIGFLHQHILEYQDMFKRLVQLSGGDSFLFLDDLYHIRRDDQAKVLDYFHRIAKGNDLWLKVGTLRQRSRWYEPGDPQLV